MLRPQVAKAFGGHGGRCRNSALPDCGWLLGHQLERQESGLFLLDDIEIGYYLPTIPYFIGVIVNYLQLQQRDNQTNII